MSVVGAVLNRAFRGISGTQKEESVAVKVEPSVPREVSVTALNYARWCMRRVQKGAYELAKVSLVPKKVSLSGGRARLYLARGGEEELCADIIRCGGRVLGNPETEPYADLSHPEFAMLYALYVRDELSVPGAADPAQLSAFRCVSAALAQRRFWLSTECDMDEVDSINALVNVRLTTDAPIAWLKNLDGMLLEIPAWGLIDRWTNEGTWLWALMEYEELCNRRRKLSEHIRQYQQMLTEVDGRLSVLQAIASTVHTE